jgi:hypothetical protein
MKRPDSLPDGRLADALRQLDPEPYDRSLGLLAARIDAATVPLFAARRLRARSTRLWWEYAAAWATMLIPIGVTVALASVVLLWTNASRVVVDPAVGDPGRILVLGAASTSVPRREIVDRAVDDLVSTRTGR